MTTEEAHTRAGGSGALDLGRRALEVAPELLGCRLSLNGVTVRLTEVEAYEGADDPASHAWRGRTPRNAVMFGPAGHLYVYFSYGIHWMANLVCGPEGVASAVLLRSGEVVEGIELARERRGPRVSDRDLARGPGRLGQAIGLRRDLDGVAVVQHVEAAGAGTHDQEAAVLVPGDGPVAVARGPRVGISRAVEQPWRFWIAGDRWVSGFRAATPSP